MSNKAKALMITVILGSVLAGVGIMSNQVKGDNATVTPGSVNDPVVTKSYIDQQVADLVKAEIAKQGGGGSATPGQPAAQGVEVVAVPVGKLLIAKDGAEFIVRAGKAVVYSTDGNGISDLTDGKDLMNGKAVPNNHLILFPRGGRGVTPAPGQTTGLTIMVRGQYELQAQQ